MPVAQEPLHPASLSGKRNDPPEDRDALEAVNPISLSGERKYPPELIGVAGSVFSPQAMTINTRSVALAAAIEKLPAWANKSSVRATMNIKKQRSNAKVNVDAFESNALKAHQVAKYSRATVGLGGKCFGVFWGSISISCKSQQRRARESNSCKLLPKRLYCLMTIL